MRLRAALPLLLLLTLVRAAAALTLLPATLDDLIGRAARVDLGRVVEVESAWTDDRRTIESRVTLELLESLKGAPATRVTFAVPGGTAGGLTVAIPGVPVLREGDVLVVFLAPSTVTLPRPVGLSQGLLRVQADAAGQWRLPTGDGVSLIRSRVRRQAVRR